MAEQKRDELAKKIEQSQESSTEEEDEFDVTIPLTQKLSPSFQCPHCDKEPYTNRQNMNRHVLTKHKSVKYSCPICAKPLGRSDNLKIHMRDRHSDKK